MYVDGIKKVSETMIGEIDDSYYTGCWSEATIGSSVSSLLGTVTEFKIYAKGINETEVLGLHEQGRYVCGDVDADREHTALDLGYLIDYLFAGGAEPIPVESGDINGDGQIDALDLGWLIDILFAGAENPNDCGNVDMSEVPAPNPTQSEKQQAQQILDDAGINIQI
ncbi:MAG: dockerin type I domain-containing protein [bacterium]